MARDTYKMKWEAQNYECGFDVSENDGWDVEVSYDGVIGFGIEEDMDME